MGAMAGENGVFCDLRQNAVLWNVFEIPTLYFPEAGPAFSLQPLVMEITDSIWQT